MYERGARGSSLSEPATFRLLRIFRVPRGRALGDVPLVSGRWRLIVCVSLPEEFLFVSLSRSFSLAGFPLEESRLSLSMFTRHTSHVVASLACTLPLPPPLLFFSPEGYLSL